VLQLIRGGGYLATSAILVACLRSCCPATNLWIGWLLRWHVTICITHIWLYSGGHCWSFIGFRSSEKYAWRPLGLFISKIIRLPEKYTCHKVWHFPLPRFRKIFSFYKWAGTHVGLHVKRPLFVLDLNQNWNWNMLKTFGRSYKDKTLWIYVQWFFNCLLLKSRWTDKQTDEANLLGGSQRS
jgi:hypothetical protein